MERHEKRIRKLRNKIGKVFAIETNLTGRQLLNNRVLNKDVAFSQEERIAFNLIGYLPEKVESLEEQAIRVRRQLDLKPNSLEKYVFLNRLHDLNTTLFYYFVRENLEEIMPIIYTPTVGEAVEKYSSQFRKQNGLFISINHKKHIARILERYEYNSIDLVLVTDGEAVLGIGDQGIGGMNISIGKIMVYVAASGIDPARVLPVQLDMGTNNDVLLSTPGYLGVRLPRVSGETYDEFIEEFVTQVKARFPNVFLHWEDLGRDNATRILEKYKDKLCTFNDDVDGTGIVAAANCIAAVKTVSTIRINAGEITTEEAFSNICDIKVVIFGAGSAGCGIARQLADVIADRAGVPIEKARNSIYLVDRYGLICDKLRAKRITPEQKLFVKTSEEIDKWKVGDFNYITLEETVKNTKSDILIGTSGQPGSFTKEIIKTMAKNNNYPIIMPLSNPTSLCEALPEDIIKWTNGKALIAAGSPFPDVIYNGREYRISQGNNAFIFPGLGLGSVAVHARVLTKGMIRAACYRLSDLSPMVIHEDITQPLLARIIDLVDVTKEITKAVAKQAILEGVHGVDIDLEDLTETEFDEEIERLINLSSWTPTYAPYMPI
ncbi:MULTISPECIES: NAD-dependent malic enzyme [Francisella]|uniref:NAD-dependent malic enzyme n=1 Tax=Francisella opportunistica TaxID=2016517 RepID=A0A345JSL2_9GAMM|nr:MULTISPECIES: NAD-dependent malic enzyme [Francisella]APC92078.1 NAD-dependent malic enzyme [Francisella sp. MA067296]AXH30308.1 NAD-dependent malic enzyme [Francisella opportunistica]AXH31949.1 NAD-dependent malic enzyme [Francisella opportunistica]AXH33595.1 NAD-dependent malic enzyme [Francisella opportunistica]